MTVHRITYEGPASLALPTATLIADSDGVDLTSAGPPQPADGVAGTVVLALTVEGAPEAVQAAVRTVAGGLPPEARVTIDDGPEAGTDAVT